MRIYFAGPLFSAAERQWNVRIAAALAAHGHTVVLPQEDAGKLIVPGAPLPTEGLYRMCLDLLGSCDAVVAILDGPDPDSGTCFECGVAVARGIPVVGVRTDLRQGGDHTGSGVNLMLAHGCAAFVSPPDPQSFEDDETVAAAIANALAELNPSS